MIVPTLRAILGGCIYPVVGGVSVVGSRGSPIYIQSLVFSDPRNSMYLALILEDF